MKFYFFLLLIISFLSISIAHEKIKLKDITVLTLNYGHMTNGRRSNPVPQLECIGGSAKCEAKYLPRVVQCKNMGSDGYDDQWKCNAELGTNLKFGKLDVNCEGYSYPNDEYVLKGSCGLRYYLDKSHKNGNSYEYKSNKSWWNTESISVIILVCGVLIAIYFIITYKSRHENPDEVPFMHTPSGPSPPGFRSEFTDPPPYESRHRYKGTTRTNDDGPGFWTGLATGGIAGYMMGSQNNQRMPTYQSTNYPSQSSHWQDYSTTNHRSNDNDESTEYRSSSGYGGTSRR